MVVSQIRAICFHLLYVVKCYCAKAI